MLNSARYKLSAAQAEQQAVEAKVATSTANLSGGQAAVRRAEVDAGATKAQVGVALKRISNT